MVRMVKALSGLLVGSVAGIGACLAQATQPPPAEGLTRIDGGVFELRQGKSVDLTRNAVLLTVKAEQSERAIEKGQFMVLIAGQAQMVEPGRRIDLKRLRSIERDLKSKEQCFLDVVDFVSPKGALATAKFRLSCD